MWSVRSGRGECLRFRLYPGIKEDKRRAAAAPERRIPPTLTLPLRSVRTDRFAGRPTKGETHEGTIRSAVGTDTQMRTMRGKARPATKEEKTNQQSQSEEHPDNVFQRDTF